MLRADGAELLRAFDAAEDDVLALEADLRSDPTVNTTVLTAELGSFSLEPLANDQSREARLRVGVRVRARI